MPKTQTEAERNLAQMEMTLRNAAWGLEHLLPALDHMLKDWPNLKDVVEVIKAQSNTVVRQAREHGYVGAGS